MALFSGIDIANIRGSIRGRLTLMAAAVVAAFLLLSISESYAVRLILHRVEADGLARRLHYAQRFFARRAETKANLISEFAFWNDTWRAVEAPHSLESRTHIRENFLEWLPQRYGERLVELWDKDRTPVWRWADTAMVGLQPGFDWTALFDRLDSSRLGGGYLQTPRGVMLVSAGVILREWDITLKGPTNGYLVAAEPIDSARLRRFEYELQESIALEPLPAGWVGDSVRMDVAGDQAQATFPLMGFDGRPAALVTISSPRVVNQQLALWTTVLIAVTMVVGVVVLGVLWRAGHRLVVRPLGEIGEKLENMERAGDLSRIETSPPTREWGLFVSAFNRTIDALKSSERRYRVLFDHAADAHLLLDAKTQTILEANPAAEQLAGRDRHALIGRPFSTVVKLEPSGSRDGTFRLRRPDGTQLIVGVATAELEIAGAPRQLASLRDLTRNEALSAQLRQAQKMEAVGSLAGGIAHDFNNLLGAVIMASSTLKEEVAGNPAAAESIQTIEQASQRAAELTRRLLSFARREQTVSAPVAMNEVVQNVVRLCERTFNRVIRIEVELDDPLPPVSGDAGQLEQALLNLCINSRDAMPQGGIIRIVTRTRKVSIREPAHTSDLEPGSYVTVSVSDTGFGLTQQAEQHLFEPFFTTKGQGKGTGLGLAMVYGMVRAHGGAIVVRNRPGQGVEFEVFLPMRPDGALEPAHTLTSGPARGEERLLLIDDEAALRRSMARALTRLGYHVAVAENGAQGARMVQEDPEAYDLVILDMVMPEMGGAEAFHVIRQIRPDMRILVCSGYSADEERNELIRDGASGFLQKPFDTVTLTGAIREILDGVRLA